MDASMLSHKLDMILRELRVIKKNTDKPEPFQCEVHGYVIPILFPPDPTDGTQALECSVCVRSAP
ncbi:hypothetical protein LCGC14_1348520 [marine sediment metagenome]|uniref:Uncharacterized protein n=1 Tax=marine sediment metagenome TaxID=412755 RepID=A0A0F9MSE5_9ZZZZ